MLINIDQIHVSDRVRSIDQYHVSSLAVSILEEGLLQPIVVSSYEGGWKLTAGGHRLEAFRQIASGEIQPDDYDYNPEDFKYIPATELEESLRSQQKLGENETLSATKLKLFELEENTRRKDLSWTEKVFGIVEYHELARREALHENIRWTQEQTGRMLGMDSGSISYAKQVAKVLRSDPNEPLWNCSSLKEALQTLVARKRSEASSELVYRMQSKQPAQDEQQQAQVENEGSDSTLEDAFDTLVPNKSITEKPKGEIFSMDFLKNVIYHGDAISLMHEICEQVQPSHIITDPPYGIDMDFLSKGNKIESVREEHQVNQNIQLVMDLIYVAYEVLPDHGFLCFWYDLDHHEKLMNFAKQIGFIPCRWPLVWCKTSACKNEAPQYNITKATEVCMILRKSSQAILAQKASNNFIVESSNIRNFHPFAKPFAVWEWLFDHFTLEYSTILDPFLGSGTSLYTGLRKNRMMYGIESKASHRDNAITWLYEKLNDQEESFVSPGDI